MKELYGFNINWIFQSIGTSFVNIIRKIKINFYHPCPQAFFCFNYGILKTIDLSRNPQSFLSKVCETSQTWFSLRSVLKKRCEHDSSLSKQKPCCRGSTVGRAISQWYRKGTFDGTKTVKEQYVKLCLFHNFL